MSNDEEEWPSSAEDAEEDEDENEPQSKRCECRGIDCPYCKNEETETENGSDIYCSQCSSGDDDTNWCFDDDDDDDDDEYEDNDSMELSGSEKVIYN